MPILKIRNNDGTWKEVFGGSGGIANVAVNGKSADEDGNITLEKSDVGIYTSSTEPTEAKDGDIWINSSDDEAIKILESGAWTPVSSASDFLVVREDESGLPTCSVAEIKAASDAGKIVLLMTNDLVYDLELVTDSYADFVVSYIGNTAMFMQRVRVEDAGCLPNMMETHSLVPPLPLNDMDCVLTANGSTLSWKEPTSGSGIPAYTETDNGKFLRIANGAPAWIELTDVSEVGA